VPSSEVFKKFGKGKLHSGSKKGPIVKDQKQAVAIKMSEERAEKKNGGKYPEPKAKKKKAKRKLPKGLHDPY
jgi:hypothetical protein